MIIPTSLWLIKRFRENGAEPQPFSIYHLVPSMISLLSSISYHSSSVFFAPSVIFYLMTSSFNFTPSIFYCWSSSFALLSSLIYLRSSTFYLVSSIVYWFVSFILYRLSCVFYRLSWIVYLRSSTFYLLSCTFYLFSSILYGVRSWLRKPLNRYSLSLLSLTSSIIFASSFLKIFSLLKRPKTSSKQHFKNGAYSGFFFKKTSFFQKKYLKKHHF